jgi:hypothetical protein
MAVKVVKDRTSAEAPPVKNIAVQVPARQKSHRLFQLLDGLKTVEMLRSSIRVDIISGH